MIYLIMTRVPLYTQVDDMSSVVYHTYTIKAESADDAIEKIENAHQFMTDEVIIGVSDIPDDGYLHYHLTGSLSSVPLLGRRDNKQE